MNEGEAEQQQKLHQVLEEVLSEQGDLPDGHMLTGWLVCFETASFAESKSCAGTLYGPREMTTWRALGLLEWGRHCLRPDDGE